jgi:hypothetical protein
MLKQVLLNLKEGDNLNLKIKYPQFNVNPILYTEWLDSHAWTLKNYTAKYYEVRKI